MINPVEIAAGIVEFQARLELLQMIMIGSWFLVCLAALGILFEDYFNE